MAGAQRPAGGAAAAEEAAAPQGRLPPPARRKRRRRRRRAPPGSPPGVLVVDPDAPRPTLHVMSYDADTLEEASGVDVAQLPAWRQRGRTLWVDVRGLGDAAVLSAVARTFGLHALALADVVHTHQRPKVEAYSDHLFIVLRAVVDGIIEQDSLLLGRDVVVTFQERPEDTFERVRQRLREGGGQIRKGGADYLVYALVDRVVDGYFPLLDAHAEHLELLEELVVRGVAGSELVTRIHGVRAELLAVRRAVWPLRDLLRELVLLEGSPLVRPETRLYLRDCADHVLQLTDALEMHRDMAKSLLELHVSLVGQRTNEITKVLTIIATIFIPLSFIASVYGMNFDPLASPYNMPELAWRFGYPMALGLMAGVGLTLLWWFRVKGWVGGPTQGGPAEPAEGADRGR